MTFRSEELNFDGGKKGGWRLCTDKCILFKCFIFVSFYYVHTDAFGKYVCGAAVAAAHGNLVSFILAT